MYLCETKIKTAKNSVHFCWSLFNVLERFLLVVVIYPAFYKKKRKDYPYEDNLESLAYISDNEETMYVQRALNGGSKDEYLKMIKEPEIRQRYVSKLRNSKLQTILVCKPQRLPY